MQEIILFNEDSDFIYGISDIFDAIILPSKCPVSECFEGRPSGGLAILWRKFLNISVNLVTVNDNFIVALLNCTDRFIGLVNIYCNTIINLMMLWMNTPIFWVSFRRLYLNYQLIIYCVWGILMQTQKGVDYRLIQKNFVRRMNFVFTIYV